MIHVENLGLSSYQLMILGPFWVMLLGLFAVILASSCYKERLSFQLSIATLCTSIGALLHIWLEPKAVLFNGAFVVDRFSNYFCLLFLVGTFLLILASSATLEKAHMKIGEYYALVLTICLGMMLLVCSQDFLSLLIALEIVSLPTYCLVGFRRQQPHSNEASLKYFLLGSMATAFLFMGIAYLYGSSGALGFKEVFANLHHHSMGIFFRIGSVFVLCGLFFKLAVFPFHFWSPDVYEGAPVLVTGLMSTLIKAATFGVILRLLLSMGALQTILGPWNGQLKDVLWIVGLGSILVGNLLGMVQTKIKRLMAYSSIAHTGYLLVGLLAVLQTPSLLSALLVYLVIYVISGLGIFLVLSDLAKGPQESGMLIQNCGGLIKTKPFLTVMLSLFLLSLAGVPPTAGFIGKYMVFYAGIQAGYSGLVIGALLASAFSMYYYLKLIVVMTMQPQETATEVESVPFWLKFSLAICFIFVLWVGFYPSSLMDWSDFVTKELTF